MTGLVLAETASPEQDREHERVEEALTRVRVVRELALDLQCALARKGRAPFVLAGLPLFDDLCALRRTLAHCLTLGDDPTLRHWYTVLDTILPAYASSFAQIKQALDWLDDIGMILDMPLPSDEAAGSGSDAVALALAHYLGPLADLTDLSPWLTQFRDQLLATSERYWSGLFHCYDIVGLPRTNNDHERLYGQIKHQLRRQLGVSQLRQPLLRRGGWIVFQIKQTSPDELRERLAQVSWLDYFAERARYESRQAQFHRRYRWRHQRDSVLQQRVVDWAKVISVC